MDWVSSWTRSSPACDGRPSCCLRLRRMDFGLGVAPEALGHRAHLTADFLDAGEVIVALMGVALALQSLPTLDEPVGPALRGASDLRLQLQGLDHPPGLAGRRLGHQRAVPPIDRLDVLGLDGAQGVPGAVQRRALVRQDRQVLLAHAEDVGHRLGVPLDQEIAAQFADVDRRRLGFRGSGHLLRRPKRLERSEDAPAPLRLGLRLRRSLRFRRRPRRPLRLRRLVGIVAGHVLGPLATERAGETLHPVEVVPAVVQIDPVPVPGQRRRRLHADPGPAWPAHGSVDGDALGLVDGGRIAVVDLA